MIRIELEPLEQKDLLEMLDYAKEMKEENRPITKGKRSTWDNTDYWINRIEILKRIVQGKAVRGGVYRSSLGTIQTDGKYHCGEGLIDVFDNEEKQ